MSSSSFSCHFFSVPYLQLALYRRHYLCIHLGFSLFIFIRIILSSLTLFNGYFLHYRSK
jgi:hypothetical protein